MECEAFHLRNQLFSSNVEALRRRDFLFQADREGFRIYLIPFEEDGCRPTSQDKIEKHLVKFSMDKSN